MEDPIVEEVRKARQDHAKRCNNDLSEICRDLKKIEKECGHKVVSLPPRLLELHSRQRRFSAADKAA